MVDTTVAIHLLQLQLVHVDQTLGLQDRLLLREHPADLHEGLVFGLWDHSVDINGHRQTNGGKHQVAVRPCRLLMVGRGRWMEDHLQD